jgi:hypothetical protein
MKGNAYISMTFEFKSARSNSTQIMKSHADISLFATVIGLFVEMSKAEKNDCEIPIYKTGSMYSIVLVKILIQI